MKTKNLLLIILFFILTAYKSKSQDIDVDIAKRILYDNYIFEGEVIRSDSYKTLDEKYIYTSSTIQISKWLKGNNQNVGCGTIEIITEGGQVGDEILDISHNLVLDKGMRGIFLCNETHKELPAIDYYPETNSLKLDVPFGNEGFIRYFDDGVNFQVADWQFQFDNTQAVYDYLQFNYGLVMVDCNAGLVVNHQHHHQDFFPHTNIQSNSINSQIVLQSVNGAGGSITSTMMNRHINNGTPKTFEFDIALSGTNDSTVYFGAFQTELVYDTLTFGSHVLNDTNTYIYNSGILPDSSYEVVANAVSADRIRINAQFTIPMPTGGALIRLPLVPQTAIHVILEIKDCNHQSSISSPSFSNPYTGYSDTIAPLTWVVYGYDTIIYSNPIEFPKCGTMHIDRVTSFLNGGVHDVMTIEGANFQSSRGSGKIFVRTANDTYSYLELDSTDYLTGTWSDTLITFEMPGDVEHYGAINGQVGVAGSGKMKLFNDVGDSATSDSITVWYSIRTLFTSYSHRKMMRNLMDDFSPYVGGYLFKTDTSFSHSIHPNRWNCVDVAIKHWVCLRNVNFSLGGDTILAGSDVATQDNVNLISIGTTNSRSTPAQTKQWTFVCAGHLAVREIDITVDKFLVDSFYCSTNCADDVPAHTYDLYAILLHELGHAHSLNHVNNYSQVMYYGQRPYNVITISNNRKIYLSTDISARDGAGYIMQHSPDTALFCSYPTMSALSPSVNFCDSLPGGRLASTLSCYPYVNEIQKEISDFELYPNPANDKLNIEFKLDNSILCSVNIYNLFGQKMVELKESFKSGKNKLTLDVGSLSTGIYFVAINSNSGSFYSKFLKQTE